MQQTLSDLIRQPNAKERAAFDAITGVATAFTAAELRLILSSLESRTMLNDSMAEKLTNLAREMPRKAPMYLRMANAQSMAACEARALADKIAKLVRS